MWKHAQIAKSQEPANEREICTYRPWTVHVDRRNLRIATLRLKRGQEIPLHDHPHTRGVLWVIAGRVSIRQCELQEIDRHMGTSRLTLVSATQLGVGGFSHFTPRSRNIHGLTCLTPRCTLLDILIHSVRPRERYWFFPLDPVQTEIVDFWAKAIKWKYFEDL